MAEELELELSYHTDGEYSDDYGIEEVDYGENEVEGLDETVATSVEPVGDGEDGKNGKKGLDTVGTGNARPEFDSRHRKMESSDCFHPQAKYSPRPPPPPPPPSSRPPPPLSRPPPPPPRSLRLPPPPPPPPPASRTSRLPPPLVQQQMLMRPGMLPIYPAGIQGGMIVSPPGMGRPPLGVVSPILQTKGGDRERGRRVSGDNWTTNTNIRTNTKTNATRNEPTAGPTRTINAKAEGGTDNQVRTPPPPRSPPPRSPTGKGEKKLELKSEDEDERTRKLEAIRAAREEQAKKNRQLAEERKRKIEEINAASKAVEASRRKRVVTLSSASNPAALLAEKKEQMEALRKQLAMVANKTKSGT